MSVYMTEEEQIESIKRWWKKYSSIIMTVLSIILLSIAGTRYWNWHHEKLTIGASTAYERMVTSYTNKDIPQMQGYANTLMQQYGKTPYADAARMLLARQLVQTNKYSDARPLLEQVAQQARVPALKQVAKARLARLYMADKQYESALDVLSTIDDAAYASLVNELKGDIYVAMGESGKAQTFYADAMKDAQERKVANLFLEMKVNELAAHNGKTVAAPKNTQTV